MASDRSSHRQTSSHQTRLVFFIGFGGLLLLLGVLGVSAMSFLSQIRGHEQKIREDYLARDRVLQALRSEIYLSGTHLRDYLVDTDDALANEYRSQFLETKQQIEDGMVRYRGLIGDGNSQAFRQFSEELDSYMTAMAPVLSWTPSDRRAHAAAFVQDELRPRRLNALTLADKIQQISESQLEESSNRESAELATFRVKLLALLLLAVSLGVTLAGLALWRLLRLEREAQARFNEVVSTREELKRLSAELVSAQENERRRISRELHDEVGQVLTAIMLGLGNLRSALKDSNSAEALRQLQLVEDMTERNASVVRNISLLLRPTMLDDLGLVPALRWYAREVTRTGPMSADVMAEAFVDDLPDDHRTCVFRIVQEAVRNAGRHSGAHQVRIYIGEKEGMLSVSVQDDGKGFNPAQEAGLGILGMQERVMSLAGKLEVNSKPGKGTIVTFSLPLPPEHRPVDDLEQEEYHEIRPFRTA